MKKFNYFLTFVAGTMMFASCSNDKEVLSSVEEGGVQQIVLQVASNGDGLTTRAGRPLLSNEAASDMQTVDLYIVGADNEVVYVKKVDWTDKVTDYSNGTLTTITLTRTDKLAVGNYKIYAYGYTDKEEEKTEYTGIPTYSIGDDFNENVILSYKEGKSTPEEIFGGSSKELFEVKEDNKRAFTETIVLNRQVAGAYFYVYNLPMVNGMNDKCKIQLVASDVNNQLILGGFNSFDLEGNGTGNTANYVVNGKKTVEPKTNVICQATLSDWYSVIEDKKGATNEDGEEVGDGIVDAGENWKTNSTSGRQGAYYVKGSVFASNFVIPFEKVAGKQTLKLQIVSEDGKNVLREWNVNLPSAPAKPTVWDKISDEAFGFVERTTEEDKNVYSIVRNHLYSVGTKAYDKKPNKDPENPDDPDDPDPDPDPDDPEPEDLSKGQNLTVKVNHNWEVIYKMEVE